MKYSDLKFQWVTQPIEALKIIESIHATALPKAQPVTDDMRSMVEHFHKLGLVQRKPCAYQMGGTMFVHPALMAEVRKHTRKVAQDIQEELMTRACLAFRGVAA